MSTYIDKAPSLIEKKKQQWAREKEELAGLSAPWGCGDSTQILRTRYLTKLNTSNPDLFLRRESNSYAGRRPSLPPIYQKQNITYISSDKLDKEMGGETSGYGSDNPNHTPEYFQQQTWNQNMGYESSSSNRDDRAKWGDKGVNVGNSWEHQDITDYSKMNDTPGWVKRGLQGETELVVSNSSPAESPEQDYGEQERPYTASTSNHSNCRSYIRGQNIPLDPVELAERERKRQLAIAHQEAIKQQLDERENRRQEEKLRRLREEREEELRIKREQDMERQRRENEERIAREKQEREAKRKAALQEALKLAENEAKQAKIKQKMLKQNLNISENVAEVEKMPSPVPHKELQVKVDNIEEKEEPIVTEIKTSSSRVSSSKVSEQITFNNCLATVSHSNNNLPQEKCNNNVAEHLNVERKESNVGRMNNIPSPRLIQQRVSTAPQENIALVLPTAFDGFQNMQFALLMPAINSAPAQNYPMAVPIIQTPRTERTENRVLTPTQYRHRRFCDSSTQTEFANVNRNNIDVEVTREKYVREKFTNLDINYDNRNRKDSITVRTSSRTRENTGDRPKWGANRPPTRYLKQSEKDPFYQRKKIRPKIRQIQLYDDKNNNYSPHSSDDSQTASPRTYRKRGHVEKRRTRALWQKNDHMFARNLRVYQTEIVPLESDKDQIYYKKTKCEKCCCHCQSERHFYTGRTTAVDYLKIEQKSPRDCAQFKSNEDSDKNRLPDCNNTSLDSDVLEKLNLLHNGLMIKQEQWVNSPRTPSLCSPRVNAENNT